MFPYSLAQWRELCLNLPLLLSFEHLIVKNAALFYRVGRHHCTMLFNNYTKNVGMCGRQLQQSYHNQWFVYLFKLRFFPCLDNCFPICATKRYWTVNTVQWSQCVGSKGNGHRLNEPYTSKNENQATHFTNDFILYLCVWWPIYQLSRF